MTAAALRLADVTLGGEVTPLPLSAGTFAVPRLSPDDRKIAYEDRSVTRVYDRLTGASPAIGDDALLRRKPAWTSAGDRVAFKEGPRTGSLTMFWPADGRGSTTRLGDGAGPTLLDFAPGDTLGVAYRTSAGLNPDLYVARIGETGASYGPLLTADWDEAGGDLSPDGRWLAYHSNESGENRVYVHSFPALTVRHEISPGPGTEPAWSPDGRRIYYRSGTGFYAVDVTTTPTFVARPPRLLFDNPRLAIPDGPGHTRNWDVRPDGTGFVMVLDEAQKEAGGTTMLDRRLTDVVLVVNWFEELRARMGSEGARR
jgi:serine/threonine-protein kinase